MSRLKLLNPLRIRDVVRQIRAVADDGGPVRIRLVGVGEPVGLLIPTSEVALEVETKGGSTHSFSPEVPVPFPYAWAWRIARRLGVPLVSAIDLDRARFALPLPRRSS